MKVQIAVGDVYSKIVDPIPPGALPIIRMTCRARPTGYRFMTKFKRGIWDGYISLMKGMKQLPTGLLYYVEEALKRDGYVISYSNTQMLELESHIPSSIKFSIPNISLRDYQVQAVTDLLKARRGIARMATNAGKTVVYAAVIKLLGRPSTLVIVQSKDLLYQTQERLAEYLEVPIGLIGDSHRAIQAITVATIQTLNSLRKKNAKEFRIIFKDNKILIVDECHHVSHNKTFDILMSIPGGYRYGMSGTPLNRGDLNDMKLVACTGPVRVEVTNAQLIDNQWSAKPLIHMYDVDSEDLWKSSYQTAYNRCIVKNATRNTMICDLAKQYSENGTVLVIVARIWHGQTLLEALRRTQPLTIFVHGKSSMEHRKNTLERLASGQHFIVIATNIFDEGVDVPALDSIILACGGKSRIRLLQRMGRGLRRKSGRNIVHIHDFIDDGNKYLLDHTEERLHVYQKEKFQIEYKETS